LHLLTLLAQTAAQTAAPTSQPAPPWLNFLNSGMLPIAIIFIAFLLFSSGGKRKQEQQRKNLLDNLKKGDHVRLIGGEYGVVADVRDKKVLIKVDESSNTKILYAREAVAAVEPDKDAKDEVTK
jgi:preprotein translocase subunit YajC